MEAVNSDLPHDIAPKVCNLVNELIKLAREMQRANPSPIVLPMLHNHNYFIGVDQSAVHLVFTNEGVTSSIVSRTERDLGKIQVTEQQISQACVRELGYRDIHYFRLQMSLLDQSPETRKPALETILAQYISQRMQPLVKLAGIGLTEAMTYLRNARSRYDTKTPEGYADCKSNCRNALLSSIKALTGQENLREGARILGKNGTIGEREEELIEALGELLAKLHNLASKKGPHPPLSGDEEDALLVLSLTECVLIYLATKATKSK